MPKTVVVVGAGASKEFGAQMPVGSELAGSIRKLLDDDLAGSAHSGPISEAIMKIQPGLTGEHTAAMVRIRDGVAGKDSIDDFVHEWRNMPFLPQVAKLCIAKCILQAEATTILNHYDAQGRLTGMPDLRDTWLGQIVRVANPGVDRRDVTNSLRDVSFVTFNYDRCIERYLTGWFQMQGLDADETVDLRRQIPVHHVYGSLGHTMEWGGTVPFGADDSWSVVRAAAQLKTYTEALTPDERRIVFELVDQAENVILLGMGFHVRNMELLFGESGFNGRQAVWATALGLRRRQFAGLRNYFSSTAPGVPSAQLFEGLTAGLLMTDQRDEIFDP